MTNYIDTAKKIIHEIKENNTIVDIQDEQGVKIGTLEPINESFSGNTQITQWLMEWRNNALYAYLDRTPVTYEGTGRRLDKAIIKNDLRLLFFVKNLEWDFIGHIWLYSFDEDSESCEIDNVLRWIKKWPGIMTNSLVSLIKFAYEKMKIKNLYLRVLSNNTRAIELYRKESFIDEKKIPLLLENIAWYNRFSEASEWNTNTEVCFLKMKYNK